MRPKARAYFQNGHGPKTDQIGRIHISDFRILCQTHLRNAAGPYIRAKATGGFNIENDAMVGVDQIVGGVGEEGMAFMGTRPLGCRV